MAEPVAAAPAPKRKKITIPMLMEKKKNKEPIVQLAVYDYENAIIADRLGIDILCVSDTGGMVLFGHESTTSVSFEEVCSWHKRSSAARSMVCAWSICPT